MTPTIDHEYCDYNNPLSGRDRDEPYCLQSAPIWIKFSLKESKEAIEKLGKELLKLAGKNFKKNEHSYN